MQNIQNQFSIAKCIELLVCKHVCRRNSLAETTRKKQQASWQSPKMLYEVFLQHVSLRLVVSCFIPAYTRCPLGNCKEKCFLLRTSDQGQKQHAEQPNSRAANIKYSFLILHRFFFLHFQLKLFVDISVPLEHEIKLKLDGIKCCAQSRAMFGCK